MGRWSKGVQFTTSTLRLEMDYIRKRGFIKPNEVSIGTLSWSNDNNVTFKTKFNSIEKYIELTYTQTYRDKKTDCKYIIDIIEVPSNLGKGSNWYFICPVSGLKAKILYLAYGSPKFMHRDEYKRRGCRIYYPVQTSSKYEYHNDRYWEIERSTIPKLQIKRGKKTYRGKPTKRYLRLQKAWNDWEYFDRMRWSPANLPKACLPYLSLYGL